MLVPFDALGHFQEQTFAAGRAKVPEAPEEGLRGRLSREGLQVFFFGVLRHVKIEKRLCALVTPSETAQETCAFLFPPR